MVLLLVNIYCMVYNSSMIHEYKYNIYLPSFHTAKSIAPAVYLSFSV